MSDVDASVTAFKLSGRFAYPRALKEVEVAVAVATPATFT
jgi:hypothetical protein